MTTLRQRVDLTPGLVLHQRPWRDTSLIVELFTAHYGRLTAFARGVRGAKAAHNRFAGLRPFQPLLLSWFGRSEAPRLTAAEPDGEALTLPAASMLSAWYLNELLLKLTAQHDPQPGIYASYRRALAGLAAGRHCEWVLRCFEKQLLEQLGFGLDLDCEAESAAPVQATASYRFVPGVGFALTESAHVQAISGRVLQALASESILEADADWRAARQLMRSAIDHCLDGRVLRTRAVARSVARLESLRHA